MATVIPASQARRYLVRLGKVPGGEFRQALTRKNLRHLPPGSTEDLGHSGSFAAQEIAGLFGAFEGLACPMFSADTQDGHVHAASAGTTWQRVVGGIDWRAHKPSGDDGVRAG